MKKIIVISSVKNESDIIESFCRYNLAYSDAMLIYENHKSSDNTREIIQNLIDEGLQITFEDFEDEEDIYYETAKRKLVKLAVEKYGADIVVPIDADEFLYHIDGENPRETLEKLQEDVEYHVPWRTYIYEKEPDSKKGFMPNNFKSYRNPSMDDPKKYHRHGKVIASKYLIEQKQAEIVEGAHFLVYPNDMGSSVKQEICKNLVVAHFPIRSQTQVMRKVIPNWINKWAIYGGRVSRSTLDAFQLGVMFNKIKETGEIPEQMLRQLSIEYAMLLDADKSNNFMITDRDSLNKIISELGKNVAVLGRMNVTFCADKLDLHYSIYKDNSKAQIKAILERVDTALTVRESELIDNAKQYKELLQQRDALTYQRDELSLQYDDMLNRHGVLTQQHIALSRQCDEMTLQRDQNIALAAELGQSCENLNKQIADIYNSTTWKIGYKIARIFRFFVRNSQA